MAKVLIPHQHRLSQLLTYEPDAGLLFWKERPLSDFANSNTRIWKSWNSSNANKPALSRVNANGYKCGSLEGRSVLSHRVIWKLVNGVDPDQVDHIDGDRLNNAISNLRGVSSAENRKNSAMQARNRSGYSGISWQKRWPQYPGRWVAFIGYERLGSFEKLEEAIEARKAAEVTHGYHENHGRPNAAHRS